VSHGGFRAFVGFGLPVRGRERQAIKLFNEVFEYYSRLQQEGEIESFEPVLLEPHGGELGGFFLLRGDQDKLARIRGSEEFERQTARGQLSVENIGIGARPSARDSPARWHCSPNSWRNSHRAKLPFHGSEMTRTPGRRWPEQDPRQPVRGGGAW
jgi:hypothetical protein